MQAILTQNVAGLGLGVRARPTARPRVTLSAKPSFVGAPVVGKSVKGVSSRKTVKPMAMADEAIPAGWKKAEVVPVAEAPFVGITKDMKARGPLYINDFMQGISFKSVVRPMLPFLLVFFAAKPNCPSSKTVMFFCFFSLSRRGFWRSY